MENRTDWIIAAAGADALRTREAGLTCLHLCTQLSLEGRFVPLAHPVSARGDYLGITDSGGVPRGCELFAAEAVAAARARGCAGIMADFERPLLQALIAALDREAQRAGLPLLVPLPLAEYAPHACAIADTAISGGSLEERFSDLLRRFGRGRIAAQLVCSCADFPLPCANPSGTPLSPEAFDRLLRRTGSTVFFSRELCAKYFTYSDGAQAHFVLFDDADTLRAKARLLHRLGVSRLLAVYPDARRMGLLTPAAKK
ncbi:MAG TPA: hypothetical protein IAA32_05450 [Candidatus Butyricicoccus stercorigallinarum]|nr:hypothetical protein [Candidatus Butyricicoccus stercorigallinarum]